MRRTPIAILALACLLAGGCARDDALSAAVARGDLAAVQRAVRQAYPDVPTMATNELAAALAGPEDRRPLLIDSRSAEEFAVSHLAGAIRDGDADGVPAGRPVVVYCSVGVRSSERARELIRAGRSDVRQLDGSIFRWAIERRPMVDSAGRATGLVHPYDRNWGRLLPADLNSASAR